MLSLECQSGRMSKIKNGGLDSMALDPSNSSSLEQLALKGLKRAVFVMPFASAVHCNSW